MTAQIKPIETRYKGYRFRSRLEARWAVWLDTLTLPWEYERQGYQLPSGPYLPDFWIPLPREDYPGSGFWIEIKPLAPTERELDLLLELTMFTGHHGYLFSGNVGVGELTVYKSNCIRTRESLLYWIGQRNRPEVVYTEFGEYVGDFRPSVIRTSDRAPNPGAALVNRGRGKDPMECFLKVCELTQAVEGIMPLVDVAFSAARAARFEHGETP
jgi:hypothetical protein